MSVKLQAASRLLALKAGPKGPKHAEPAKRPVSHSSKGPKGTEPAKQKVTHPGSGPKTPKHMRRG